MGLTMFDKLWAAHEVRPAAGEEPAILYIDLHLVHEVTSPQAFEGLRLAGRRVRRPDRTLATVDHNVPTLGREDGIDDPLSKQQVETLERNCAEFGVPLFSLRSPRQGIVHVIGPELGLTQPGMTIVCGDSHTSTHGAFGALAFGIGTSEVEHVLATQTLHQRRAKTMRVTFEGDRARGVTAKDMILGAIGQIGVGGAAGHVVEYAGPAVRALSMEGRMTICNMTIEGGGRAGMIAPDETTFEYLEGRPGVPADFSRVVEEWRELPSDWDAVFDREVLVDVEALAPQVTWGTTPGMVAPITSRVPVPEDGADAGEADSIRRALEYMGLDGGEAIEDIAIDTVFLGSCTNGRIEDLRAAADVIRGRQVAGSVRAMVVPGSMQVKAQAEREGLDEVFRAAGFDWRDAGCSMCLGMNPDILEPGERCASTSNRNFEGRQGKGGRTHLVSPEMAAAAAVTGHLVDVRHFDSELVGGELMEEFTRVRGPMAPLHRHDVDTDQIIPKQFLKRIERSGFGEFVFHDWRDEDGYVLHDEDFRDAPVLVTGRNFGCGSSREHAPWALADHGYRAIIAPSFADIFHTNCTKNGVLPVVLDEEVVIDLIETAHGEPGVEIEVDLQRQVVVGPDGREHPFEVEGHVRERLLNGWDDVSITLRHEDSIDEYERERERPGTATLRFAEPPARAAAT